MSAKIQTSTKQFHFINSKAAFYQLILQEHLETLDRKCYTDIIKSLRFNQDNTDFAICNKQYSYARNYELFEDNGTQVLIKKRENPDDPVIRYLPLEDTFDFLIADHLSLGHDKTEEFRKTIGQKYVVNERYADFILLTCNVCSEKQYLNGIEIKSGENLLKQLNNKVRLEICDMAQFGQDGRFKFLLIYVDVETSYTLLRPLMLRCAFEVATELLNIFAGFGPPAQLTTNESELPFFAEVLNNVSKFSPGLKMPDVKDFKTNYSNDLLRLFDEWMTQTDNRNWGIACHLFQWSLNNTLTGIFISESNSLERLTKSEGETPFITVFRNLSDELDIPFSASTDNKGKKREKVQERAAKDKSDKQNSTQDKASSEWYKGKPALGLKYDVIIEDEVCCVCERRMLKAYTCRICHNSVHLFCSEDPTYCDLNGLVYTCFNCGKVEKQD